MQRLTFDARIQSNTITVANGLAADGILVNNAGGGTINSLVSGNTIDYAGTQRAIALQGGQDGSSDLHTTITNNNIDIKLDGAGDALNAIFAQSQVADPSGARSFLCADIGGAWAWPTRSRTPSAGASRAAISASGSASPPRCGSRATPAEPPTRTRSSHTSTAATPR